MKNPGIVLRRAELEDSDLVLGWRNDAEAIRQSVSGSAVEAAVHQLWFEGVLQSSTTMLLIAETELKTGITPIGMCRFDLLKAGVFAVSINMGPNFRGRGLGGTVLQSGIAFLKGEVSVPLAIEAVVHESNSPSLRVFEKTGFSVFGQEAPWLHLRLAPQGN